MLKRIKPLIIDKVAREIHQYISIPTISMYYAMRKLVDAESTPEEKEIAANTVNSMMITAENLYENLSDEQKELIRKLAQDLIKIVKS